MNYLISLESKVTEQVLLNEKIFTANETEMKTSQIMQTNTSLLEIKDKDLKNQIAHIEKGTNYGSQGIRIYEKMRHGPDGALFLDPYFLPFLLNLKDQIVLDAGCGAGPWSVFAAKNGAKVFGIDIQPEMVEKSRLAAREAGVDLETSFEVGDVGALPYEANFFDRAISINVGCNLPSIKMHIQELHRVLKKGGVAILTAPASFGTLFTDGKRSKEEVVSSLDELLENQDSFPQCIQGQNEIYRATFAKRHYEWILMNDESTLVSGEQIWRKIPMMVVPNYFHSKEEYREAFKKEGFHIKEIFSPHFNSEEERLNLNKRQEAAFGPEYVAFSPFTILVAEKI